MDLVVDLDAAEAHEASVGTGVLVAGEPVGPRPLGQQRRGGERRAGQP
jgi:hypothetical protein